MMCHCCHHCFYVDLGDEDDDVDEFFESLFRTVRPTGAGDSDGTS